MEAATESTPSPDSTAAAGPLARPEAPSVVVQDTSAVADTTRTPGGALRRALLLPGLGQAYNGEAYKIPFVVGALIGAGAYAAYNNDRYVLYRRAFQYQSRVEAGVDLGEFAEFEDEWVASGSRSAAALQSLRTSARSSRDVAILITGLVYALQAADAFVAAELQGFDVSDDLSLRVAPEASGGAVLTLRVGL